MARYRTISMNFWTDSKVVDDFTSEDKFFYLYLLTNPHTNLSGCYEISMTQMSNETGYNKKTVEKLVARMSSVLKIIRYSNETKEMLVLNWHKYNWTDSDKFRKPLLKEIEAVKEESFRKYLMALYEDGDSEYPIDTYCIDTTVSVSVTDTVTVTDSVNKSKKYFEDEILNETFLGYLEERKGMKVKNTDRAVNQLIKELNDLSHGDQILAADIVNQSIKKGWKSFYPLNDIKAKQNGKQSQIDYLKSQIGGGL